MIATPGHSLANPALGSAAFAYGAKDSVGYITFSVGTKASAPDEYITKHPLESNVRVSVENGLATFSYPQSHPYVGVGDEVTTDSHTFYLNEKVNADKWRVITANGSAPDNFTNESVTKIDKTFDGILSALNGGASGALALTGSSDLVGLGSVLRIATYDMVDDIDTTTLVIQGWTTDENYYVKIFAPYDIKKECNSRQRHEGVFGMGYKIEKDITNILAVDIQQDYTEIEGVIFDGGSASGDFTLIDSTTSASGYKIFNCILTDADKGMVIENGSVARGNIIYDMSLEGIIDSNGTGYYINNTIFGCGTGIASASGAAGISWNNLIQNCSNCMTGFPAGKTFTTIIDDVSNAEAIQSINVVVRDEPGDDFHLDFASNLSADAINGGTVFISNDNFRFDKDVDGKTITGSGWHIGAHRFNPVNYFAVGNPQTDIKVAGNLSINNSGVMNFTAAQTDPRMTVGCVVNDGSNDYFLYERIDDSNWKVTDGSGLAPASLGATAISSITFPFVDGYEALFDNGGNAGVRDVIGSYDLVASRVRVGISIVDGEIVEGIKINDSFVTDVNHNIEIFTPNNVGVNCNTSRRHSGVFDDTLPYINSGTLSEDGIVISKGYTKVEGLQITGSGAGVKITKGLSSTVIGNIIKETGSHGISVESDEPSEGHFIVNNLIYRSVANGINVSHESDSMESGINIFLYNNSAIDCEIGINVDARGDVVHSNVVSLINNLSISSREVDYASSSGPSKRINSASNYASDESLRVFKGRRNADSLIPKFVDRPNDNFHLTLFDLMSMPNAIDMGADSFFNFITDYEGDVRSDYRWSAGADNWHQPKETIASFSMGDNNTDLKGSVSSVDIRNSLLVFDVSSPSNVGVGDRVVYDSGTCYLSERGNDRTWYVTNNQGQPISVDVTGDAVSNIRRVSNTLKVAIEGAAAGSVEGELSLPGRDLVASNINKLNVWCYNDSGVTDDGDVTVSGWTTDSSHIIQIQSPWDETQSNAKQRHSGTYASNGFAVEATAATCIVISNNYVTLSGFKITPLSNSDDAISIASGLEGVIVHGNIIKDSDNGIIQQGAGVSQNVIIGNIIYSVVTSGIDSKDADVHNNTIVNSAADGIISASGVIVNNNICQDCSTNSFSGLGTLTNNLDDGTSAGVTNGNRQNYTLVFKDKASSDYHLSRADWAAINAGSVVDTSQSPTMNYDIDGELTLNEWSIGADYFDGFETLEMYFSVSRDQSDIKSGSTPEITIVSGLATFDEPQDNAKMGIGDRVEYDGSTKECFLQKKIDESTWEVRTKYGELPEDISDSTVDEIRHTFEYLNYLFNNANPSSFSRFIGDSDNQFYNLSAYKMKVNFAGYKAPHIQNHLFFTLEDYIVDEDHNIRVYTPIDTVNECNSSQRHTGKYDPAEDKFRIQHPSNDTKCWIKVDYTTIEGAIIESTTLGVCVRIDDVYGCTIRDNIIRTPLIGIEVLPNISTARTFIFNNLIIDASSKGIEAGGDDVIYNNTVIDATAEGIDNSATDIVVNNIVQGCTPCFSDNTNIEFCISDDASAGTSNKNQPSITLTFADAVNKDFNLVVSDVEARGKAKVLGGDSLIPFLKDGKGIDRGRFWDIGAYEFVVTKKVKFSVGNDIGDHSTNDLGPLTYVMSADSDGRTIITFSEAQTHEKLGAGDRVFDFSNSFQDGCLLYEKISDEKWYVTDWYGEPISDYASRNDDEPVGAIRRFFNDLGQSINTGGVFDFIESPDMVFKEIKIDIVCYDDREFFYPHVPATADDIISDPDFYLTIRASNDTEKEVNSENRHFGNINSGYIFQPGNSFSLSDGFNYGIKISNTDYMEVSGIIIQTMQNGPGTAIEIEDSLNVLIKQNVIALCEGGGIRALSKHGSRDLYINNLIYKCQGPAIKVGNSNGTFTTYSYAYNNTIVGCESGIHFVRPTGATNSVLQCTGNIIQDSLSYDFVSDNHASPGFFVLTNNISRDYTADDFNGSGNYSNELVYFSNKSSDAYELSTGLDKSAIDSSIDLRSNPDFYFDDDIAEKKRDNNKWDIGAFETVEVVGSGDTEIPALTISGIASASNTAPTLILHLRTVNDPSLATEIQFASIPDLNTFLDDNPVYNAFNLTIYVQGGDSFEGTLELKNRGINRTVLIETRPGEKSFGPGSLVYDGPMVDDASAQKLLTFRDLKVYSVNAATQPYLLNNTALTTDIEFINSIVQVNEDAIIDNIPSCNISFRNSILIFRNTSEASPADMFMVKNDTEGNVMYNSMVLSYNDSEDLTFYTTNKAIAALDEVRNSLSYNYGSELFNFGNDPLTTSELIDNENPLFKEAVLSQRDFVIDITMKEDFEPIKESQVLNKGSNSYIDGIETDIIGEDRIFEDGRVDIGPYELAVRQILFSSERIRQLYQDKLTLDSRSRVYNSTKKDTVFRDLYDQFINNPGGRVEFTRESKIVISLREASSDYAVFTDKEKTLIKTIEAYYDSGTNSIVSYKIDELLGGMFSSVFDDGRYSFFFDELESKLFVFENNTFDKGLSGIRSAVKNVKFGGVSVV